MIRLRPIQTEQTFSIIPSTYNTTTLGDATLSLIENGTDVEDEGLSFSVALSSNGNFIEVSLTPSVTLKEGQIYTVTIKSNTDIYYRDLIYITAETSKKEVFTLPDNYNEYNSGKDEYIVL